MATSDDRKPSRRVPARSRTDLQDLARRYTKLAVETLAEVARTSDKEAARVAAANALLERGWGRAGQTGVAAAPVRIEVVTGIDRAGPAAMTLPSDEEVPELADIQGSRSKPSGG